MENLGNYFKEVRIKNKLTQLEVAKKLGYNTSMFVSLYERGMSNVPPAIIGKYIKEFKLNKNAIIKIMVEKYKNKLIKEMGIED